MCLEISDNIAPILLFGGIATFVIFVFVSGSREANEQLKNRDVNKRTIEEQLPALEKALSNEKEDSLLKIKLASIRQLYLNANTILNRPNVWTYKHFSGQKQWDGFHSHDDADEYLSTAATSLAELQCLLAAQDAGYSVATS